MQLSANEIYQTARKACLASGYPHDRAEDVAFAVSWLQSAGFDGCSALLDMLAKAKKDYLSAGLRSERVGKNIILDIGHLHPAFEGVAAIDWLLAGDKGAEIKIGRLSHPLIFAGLLWWAGHIYQQAFILTSKDTQETIHLPSSDIGAVSALSRLTGQISIQPGDGQASIFSVPAGHSAVAGKVWDRLLELAAHTYVPESEASRLSGAGAGLVDNDGCR